MATSMASAKDENSIPLNELFSLGGDKTGTWEFRPAAANRPEGAKDVGLMVTSLGKGEQGIGVLRSKPFVIEADYQQFLIAGADGTAELTNAGRTSWVRLRRVSDDEILHEERPPGTHILAPARWDTSFMLGEEVYLELTDGNPQYNPQGFAWIGIADYRQVPSKFLEQPVEVGDLYGLRIDSGAERLRCRTLPFLSARADRIGESRRTYEGPRETIPVGAQAWTLYLSGLINEGWDWGVAHWGEHMELHETRPDQVYIGTRIGEIEIRYASGQSDRIPVEMGATAWWHAQWAHGPTHGYAGEVQEPFASRPEYREILERAWRIRENTESGANDRHNRYFLAVRPRDEVITDIVVHDNPEKRGRPWIAGVTLQTDAPTGQMLPFGDIRVDSEDIEPVFHTYDRPDWSRDLKALADCLYMQEDDLPQKVDVLPWPDGFEATRIRFKGDRWADMLTNMWTVNLKVIDEKFNPETGKFHESGKNYPWYGGYSGIGTWAPVGVYYDGAFPRCSDHFVTLALRLIENTQRLNAYLRYVDHGFYTYRDNHDPEKGPANHHLDADDYPSDAPSHWGFVCPGGGAPWEINEIPGDEETDGHGATMVGRWVAWRVLGMPTDEWMTAPREDVFGKSRWDVTREAAEFVCWLMDYTGMDVMYCEGETTGWSGGGVLLPPEFGSPRDDVHRRELYANADMYEPYPTFVCMTALRCSSEMADAMNKTEDAERWRKYADRLESGMLRQLAVGPNGMREWKQSRLSVYPSMQDSLVQAWFAMYRDGLDPNALHPEMTAITRKTLERQLNYPYGHAPALAMGYGMGWITQASLQLDAMDDAGKLLVNIARYAYDANMDYVDEERGIDWRRYAWMIPEGTNILPDRSWYRIGDLTNGANQGPPLHAMELCAGVDDTDLEHPRLLPRVPDPLEGIEVQDFPVLVRDASGLRRIHIDYEYIREGAKLTLTAREPLPSLSVRVGPFDEAGALAYAENVETPEGATVRPDRSGAWRGAPAFWVWVDVPGPITELKLK